MPTSAFSVSSRVTIKVRDANVVCEMWRGFSIFLIWTITADPLAGFGNSPSPDNALAGHPRVVCTREGVLFEMETDQPFTGQLYVKNEFENPKCRATFGESRNGPGAVFRLNFNECSMRRRRMVQPKGVMYSVTMMVQFHPVFVTKGDKAYQIRCFYQEIATGVNVTSAFDVSPLTTVSMDATHSVPSCSYSIHLKALDGPQATLVSVGDTVVHVFRCEDAAYNIYRLLIKDCYVDDGKLSKQKIVGSDGCSVEPEIMQTPVYSETKLEAMAEAYVFKWPDEECVFFQCQISLCMRDSGACEYVTPPKCDRRWSKRSVGIAAVEFDSEPKGLTVLDVGRDADILQGRLFRSTQIGNRSTTSEAEKGVDFYWPTNRLATNCLGVETLLVVGVVLFLSSILSIIALAKLCLSPSLLTTVDKKSVAAASACRLEAFYADCASRPAVYYDDCVYGQLP